MKLFIGLGNPGTKYTNTRHNVGFLFLDAMRTHYNLPQPQYNKKFNAFISQTVDKNGEKILLVAPQTFMNRSGNSVRALVDFYKIPLENIIVVHDDLDIIIGNYKITDNAGTAGHNGVQSIIDVLGTQAFTRIRIGIEKEGGRNERGNISGEDFVLHNFSSDELILLSETFQKIIATLA